MTPEPTGRDAFAQLCRDLAAEQRHARPEKTLRTITATGPASAAAIAELVNAVNPATARARHTLTVIDGRKTA